MMRRTTLVIDEEQLAKAKKILGTTGIRDTVATAFAEIIAIDQRKKLAKRLSTTDGLDLDDPAVIARAWR